MTTVSVTSPFPESDWDRRLDTMLQDLETTNGSAGGQMAKGNSFTQQQSSSYSFSSSSSSQQMSSSSYHTLNVKIFRIQNLHFLTFPVCF